MLTLTRDNTTQGLVVATDNSSPALNMQLYNSSAKVKGVFLTNDSLELRIDEDVRTVKTFDELTINGVVQSGLLPAQVAVNLSVLFFKGSTGGGGGATPDLQAVCGVGFTTNTFVLQQADDKGIYSLNADATIGSIIGTNQTDDSGYLKIKNKAAVVTTLLADVNSAPEVFRFKNNQGDGGTLQTVQKEYSVNLSAGSFVAQKPGIYEIRTTDLVNDFTLPDPALFPGDEIIIISTDNINPCLLNALNAPIAAGGGIVYNIVGVNAMQRHLSVNGKWRGIEVF